METRDWPVGDRPWAVRYQLSMAGKHVPAVALEERERELLDAVRAAGLPAAEVFGDADVLAAEDVAELATADEAVRVSAGGGVRPALQDVGGTLVAVGVLVAAGAAAVAGIASAASLGPGRLAASDVPVAALGVGLLAPGVVTLVVASRMPQPDLRRRWDDAEWLRRFRGGLRARLVPASTARGHVVEIEQALGSGTASAAAEFGHPLVLARELAEVDRTARTRRWWLSTVAGTGTPLVIAALVVANDSWGALTIPVVVVLLLGALMTAVVRWGDRPWGPGR